MTTTPPRTDVVTPQGAHCSITVQQFVRTPFSVRCNVVKVWRPLPADFWTGLTARDEQQRAIRAERRALAGVLVLAILLFGVFAGMGYQATDGVVATRFPLLGWSQPNTSPDASAGWCFNALESWTLAFWVVGPSMLGWAFVRAAWIPLVIRRRNGCDAALAAARHLGSAYLYVYLMVVAGAALMIPLVALAPFSTEWLRWCFWCFLFGESFFVPCVMWSRLVMRDRSGAIFGRYRFALLGMYVALFVVLPIIGMVRELD